MRDSFRNTCKMMCILTCSGVMLLAQQTLAQAQQSVQSFRSAYGALMDSYDQVFRQEGDARGQDMVAKAKSAMQMVKDADLARIFSKSGMPDVSQAQAAIQRVVGLSQQAIQSKMMLKSLPFPGAPTVIQACIDTPHGDQITYDALIAFQVTSGILAAAAWVCNEDILGENGSAVCIPFAIANDIASSLFAVRSFCAGLDTAATVLGNYDRLDHIHTDLGNAQTAIINNTNANTTTLTNNINASATSIINNDNSNKNSILASIAANTATIVNNSNANTTTLINNENTNRDMIVGELKALGCEIIRLLNTPDGQKASSILACSAQPGFPYSWNKH